MVEQDLGQKVYLLERVYKISESRGIKQATVLRVVSKYLELLREDLIYGKEVTVLGLFTVLPNKILHNTVDTTAMYSKRVGVSVGIPYHTCLEVLKLYLDALRAEVLSGSVVNIRGFLTIKPIMEMSTQVGFHASVSQSIKKDLELLNTDVTSVRVHTHKLLKSKIKYAVESVM